VRRFFKFWCECARFAARGCIPFANDWQWTFGNPAVSALGPTVVLGFAAMGLDTTADHPILGPFLIALGAFVISWLVIFLVRLVRAPVELDRQKLDRADLEHLLFGRFLGSTFLYGAEITLCKDYKGKFAIEQLRDFDPVSVRAPGSSVAHIRLQFFHLRTDRQYLFRLRDANKETKSVSDIYKAQEILLNEKSCFGLMLTTDENFPLDDDSLVRVTVEAWTR
jgi:hypothetical protein